MSASAQPLLRVSGLAVDFRTRGHHTRAVRGVSFDVAVGETVGLVGESGSGKTTIARAILGLVTPSSGTIELAGRDLTRLRGRARRPVVGDLQAVFQDPVSSLNPALRVGAILSEPLRSTGGHGRGELKRRAEQMLERVGLERTDVDRYPGSFSGGQRQRIAIARALMVSPKLVICDEAVSALDLSVQASLLNLLRRLQDELGLSYLFIGHDLDVVRYMSRRIVVLYRGVVLEQGPADRVARTPRQPYTQALVAAKPALAPQAHPTSQVRPETTWGRATPEQGCPFAPRCPHVVERCREEMPAPRALADGGEAACHRLDELDVSVPASPAGHPSSVTALGPQ